MKYIKQTLLYFKSNILLLPALIVACAIMPLIIDFTAYDAIKNSFDGGMLTADFFAWFKMFLIFNTTGVPQALLSVLAYAVLAIVLGYIHSVVDKHVRFGSKSFKSIMNGINGTVMYCIAGTLLFFVFHAIICSIMAAIMSAFCLIPTPYAFVIGAVICGAILVASVLLIQIFFLWFPCLEITGFRAYEALSYSYSLCHKSMGSIFVSLALPILITSGVVLALSLLINVYVAAVIVSILMGMAFTYLSVLDYIIYANVEGIEREDLRRY